MCFAISSGLGLAGLFLTLALCAVRASLSAISVSAASLSDSAGSTAIADVPLPVSSGKSSATSQSGVKTHCAVSQSTLLQHLTPNMLPIF